MKEDTCIFVKQGNEIDEFAQELVRRAKLQNKLSYSGVPKDSGLLLVYQQNQVSRTVQNHIILGSILIDEKLRALPNTCVLKITSWQAWWWHVKGASIIHIRSDRSQVCHESTWMNIIYIYVFENHNTWYGSKHKEYQLCIYMWTEAWYVQKWRQMSIVIYA